MIPPTQQPETRVKPKRAPKGAKAKADKAAMESALEKSDPSIAEKDYVKTTEAAKMTLRKRKSQADRAASPEKVPRQNPPRGKGKGRGKGTSSQSQPEEEPGNKVTITNRMTFDVSND